MSNWDERSTQKERRNFVEARADRTSITGVALIFTTTFAASSFVSFALLKVGVTRMPLRYAISFCAAYAVFFCAVRVWADFQKVLPQDRPASSGVNDFPMSADVGGEGCLIVLGLLLVSLLISAVLWGLGGFAMLLEVAFEVAFAGTVVRRVLSKSYAIGDWYTVLFKRTWLAALVIFVLVVGCAQYLQWRAPQATKLSQAIAMIKTSK